MELFAQITFTLIAAYMIYRFWPVAKHYFEKGERGTNQQWIGFYVILAAVVGFVFLLMWLVKK